MPKHLFIDTNILIDLLIDRKPFSDKAEKLFEASAIGKAKLYVSSVSFNNIYYIVRQNETHKKSIELLEGLEKYVEILPVDSSVIKKSLASNFNDFEDAIQNFSAESNSKIEAIITRNEKDFKKSNLPVFAPEMILSIL